MSSSDDIGGVAVAGLLGALTLGIVAAACSDFEPETEEERADRLRRNEARLKQHRIDTMHRENRRVLGGSSYRSREDRILELKLELVDAEADYDYELARRLRNKIRVLQG